MSALLDPGLVDKLQGQWPDVDVHAIAAMVTDWHARCGKSHPRGVRNPNGLLVSWTRQAAATAAERRGRAAAMSADDQERYAVLQVELFRAVAKRGLTPIELALVLESAAAHGYERLNPRTAERLRRMGCVWPDDP